MEVHHHPHVEKKNFKEYFLEFLMIFLAVTMGFFAESIRERIVNNEKEQHYMESLVQDLKKDSAELNLAIAYQKFIIKQMDSALKIPTDKLKDISMQDSFYHHFTFFYSWLYLFSKNDNTITQLRNAGGFSVIRKKEVVDSIGELEQFYNQGVKSGGDYYDYFFRQLINFSAEVVKCPEPLSSVDTTLGYLPMHVEVFTRYDKPLLEELYSGIRNEKGTVLFYINYENRYKNAVERTINFITREYDIKTE